MIIQKICQVEEKSPTISTPSDLVPLLQKFNYSQEQFVVTSINAQNEVISMRVVSVGTVNKCIVHPRDVFRMAITDNAAGIIVSHNHPSGNCRSSDDDITTTNTIVEAG